MNAKPMRNTFRHESGRSDKNGVVALVKIRKHEKLPSTVGADRMKSTHGNGHPPK
jgi:hypothetical protein